MKKHALLLLLLLAAVFLIGPARADDTVTPGVTAVIDIDNRPVSIAVDDLPACINAVANRINALRALYQNNFTVTDVIGECFAHDGRLLLAGRCGVRTGSGQITRLCVPEMR